MIRKSVLSDLYLKKNKSKQEIALYLKCSLHKIKYWMEKYSIPSRSISDAVYLKNNPLGDPFRLTFPRSTEDMKLFGLGLGLYWGEGTKADKVSIRLGNTDPELLGVFIKFLERFFGIKKNMLHFSLQIFEDLNPRSSLDFWAKKLTIERRQFYKPTVSPSVSRGTYRRKAEHGVLTIYFHNRKARDVLNNILADVAQWQSNSMVGRTTPPLASVMLH